MALNAEIEKMIIRQLRGNSSAADDQQIREWLNSSSENQKEYEDLRQTWEAAGAPSHKLINVDREWREFRQKHFAQPQTKVIRLQAWMRYVAAAVVVIGLLLSGLYFSGNETYQTEGGERLLVELADGSRVTLSQETSLEVPRSFNWFGRSLSLRGEATFEVTKNPEKAFQIEGAKTSTRVLGTAFRLKASEEINQLSVAEGKVAYWSSSVADTLILTSGKMGELKGNQLVESSASEANYASWKSGHFEFENTPVTEVLQSLQDYYIFSISNLDDFNEVKCRFSGSFSNQSLEEVLNELSLTMGMEYELENKTLTLEQFYCN